MSYKCISLEDLVQKYIAKMLSWVWQCKQTYSFIFLDVLHLSLNHSPKGKKPNWQRNSYLFVFEITVRTLLPSKEKAVFLKLCLVSTLASIFVNITGVLILFSLVIHNYCWILNLHLNANRPTGKENIWAFLQSLTKTFPT